MPRKLPTILLLMLFAVALSRMAFAAEVVGAVQLATGVVTASAGSGPARTLARGSEVHRGETLATASDSFIVVRMNDGSRITLRPQSEMTLKAYSEESGNEEALFNLVKGGLRALSGEIGTTRPESFRVETTVATIGIRGTDFLVRLCADDCREEEMRFGDRPRRPGGSGGGNGGGPRRKEVVRIGESDNTGGRGVIECQPAAEVRHGLYAAVLEGGIFVATETERVELDAVEAVLVDEREIICLGDIPHFIFSDDYLSDNPGETVTLFNILRNLDEERQYCAIPEA